MGMRALRSVRRNGAAQQNCLHYFMKFIRYWNDGGTLRPAQFKLKNDTGRGDTTMAILSGAGLRSLIAAAGIIAITPLLLSKKE